MKNRRNTRRGRAKRWRHMGGGVWTHASGNLFVYSDGWADGALWHVERDSHDRSSAYSICDPRGSRSSAMRAAEVFARRP